jgi:hypothetical protein
MPEATVSAADLLATLIRDQLQRFDSAVEQRSRAIRDLRRRMCRHAATAKRFKRLKFFPGLEPCGSVPKSSELNQIDATTERSSSR